MFLSMEMFELSTNKYTFYLIYSPLKKKLF
uniref:Uncharacterized protein n=1 Tax=Siphoviridae sp. ctDmQ3 TaxID=2823570 RepID=A0A8S5L7X0_9CAUD|nr:MAG TPA: hypothetical protein [Siphoviridae sp. ctDmQ3]